MKNKNILKICVSFLLTVLCCNSCVKNDIKKDPVPITGHYFGDFYYDDSKALSEILTTSYPLKELEDFFAGSLYEEDIYKDDVKKGKTLYISDVNDKFPIECLRSTGCVVYKVTEGGYFYVFFIRIEDFKTNQTIDSTVFFYTYFNSGVIKENFDNIIDNVSTVRDVYKVDPSLELITYMSSRVCSCSLLKNNMVMEIDYEVRGKDDKGIMVLAVIKKEVIPRSESVGRISLILDKDLPY